MERKPLYQGMDLKLNWIDRAISYVAPGMGKRRMESRIWQAMSRQFKGAEMDRTNANWLLGMDTATPDTWELETLRDRSRDLNRNDPVASGATETMSQNIVGRGLRLQSSMSAASLGVTEDRAKELRKQAEGFWQTWQKTADSGNRLTWDEIQFVALRKIVEDGEILALPVMASEQWRPIKRCIELIEAHRLMSVNSATGIEFGKRGEPKRYHIRKANSTKTNPYPAFDSKGRPQILHIFPTKRPGQQRGYPYFAPVINYFKELSDYIEAEVMAARVAACLAVFVTKEESYKSAYNITTQSDDGKSRYQELEPGLVGYLEPGEAVSVVDPKRPGGGFQGFIETILRQIGISLGLPYEILVKDFSKTNYSSARAALLEARKMFQTWRTWFGAKFNQPVYELVMEEGFLRGMLDMPEFYKYKNEYCRAEWIGGGWGWVDPVKEVEASRKAIDYGLSTLAEEVGGQGRDWEEVLEQIKREQDKAAELGVIIASSSKDSKPEAEEKEDEEDAETKEK